MNENQDRRVGGERGSGPGYGSGTGAAGVETDPRFPSGRWQGFYVQGQGRGAMELMLTFRDGSVEGVGRDPVGSFSFDGVYDLETGKVSARKQYLGAHAVEYDGNAEAQHGIWGLWRMFMGRGGFQIWPEGHEGLRRAESAKAEQPGPVELVLEPAALPG